MVETRAVLYNDIDGSQFVHVQTSKNRTHLIIPDDDWETIIEFEVGEIVDKRKYGSEWGEREW